MSAFGNKSMAYEAVSTKIATYHTNPRPRFIEKNKWVAQINNDDLVTGELAQEGVYPDTVYDVKEPRNEISDAALVTVINRPSHVNAANISGLKLLNISNKTLRVNSSSKIYSAERADYTTLTDASYSECVKSSKQDWFVALKGLDYPFFIRDPNYFNYQEHDLEFRLGKKGQINVDYIGARYKFSNIFRYDSLFFDASTSFPYIEPTKS